VKVTKNVDVLTEYVRHNLSETIKKMYMDANGVIHAISLDQQLEQAMTNSLQTSSQASLSPTLGLSIELIKGIQKSISEAIDEATLAGFLPTIICSAQIRPYFYRMIHSQFPMVNVISYTELPSDTDINIVASVKV
jgi:flagellar biosynthesis protein FlhA